MSAVEFSGEELEIRSRPTLLGELAKFDALDIARAVASRHGITVDEMLGVSRLAHLVQARRDMYAMLRAKGWSYPAIGRFARRDHTTIMSALGKLRETP